MTIKIITGTILGIDSFGNMKKLYNKGMYYQWYHTKKGWGKRKSKIISNVANTSFFRIIQTTGSGKTILAAIWIYQAHKKNLKTAANMDITFCDSKIDSYESFLELTQSKILLDDIRHVIVNFQEKSAKLASEFANSSRKKGNEIYITTQRLENFVPPDIRMIADEIHVPYIRCFDATKKAPDGRFLPLELVDLRFSAGMEFLDWKSYNLSGKTGKTILNSFNTLEISKGLE